MRPVPLARADVVRPSWGWFALLDGGIVVLTLLSVSAKAHAASPVPLPPQRALRALLGATAVIHTAEALAAGGTAHRRGLPVRGWMLQTLTVGFPSLLALRRVPAQPAA
jgi:hypothetical protein